jgi:hypothetical protein
MSLNPPPALLPVPLLANHPRLHAHLHESRQPRRPDAARRPVANDANLGECSPSWAGKSRARLGKTDSPIRLATPPEKLKDARRKHEEGRRSSGVQGREEMQAPGKKGWGQWREKSREEIAECGRLCAWISSRPRVPYFLQHCYCVRAFANATDFA